MNPDAEAEVTRLRNLFVNKPDALRLAIRWAYADAERICRAVAVKTEPDDFALDAAEECADAIAERAK